ncbi:MAG TPA: 2-amino-4-hydroxy-6-hydroxymethyldihydropteridine diphosphokinase, partial [Verrucomicrobia bacterium]|nr:2-amino-4-hydroxy-6-hydroxymethyldihydropteridine diphosphokinase [Verrucomicrobiota bacterium]
MKPSASAPASTAARASSAEVMPQIFTRTLTPQDAMRSGPSVNARVGFGLRRRVGHGKTKRVSDEPKMAFVALGANIGDAAGTMRLAAAEIADWSRGPALGSSLWRTEPVDCPPGSPPFLNAALGLQAKPGTTPESLLADLLALEARLGRTRSGLANAPRVIDLDLIAFGTETRTTPTLVLPHPRAHERAFVL